MRPEAASGALTQGGSCCHLLVIAAAGLPALTWAPVRAELRAVGAGGRSGWPLTFQNRTQRKLYGRSHPWFDCWVRCSSGTM